MNRFLLLLAAIHLAGCPSNVHTGAWVVGQDGHSRNTTQLCQRSAEAVRAADLAIPLALRLYEAKGYCKDYEAAYDNMRGHLGVCLIDQPEPCHPSMPWPRHGCASYYNIVQSIHWPPLCDRWPGIPDKPFGCVKTEAEQHDRWEPNFVHEATNLVLQRCGVYDPSYKHPARQLGPEIWRRYQAARGGAQ